MRIRSNLTIYAPSEFSNYPPRVLREALNDLYWEGTSNSVLSGPTSKITIQVSPFLAVWARGVEPQLLSNSLKKWLLRPSL